MNLEQFAVAVATELKKHNIDVILTGGAVVSIYSTGKYVSKDADFLSATDHITITQVMHTLGFKNVGKDFYHDDTNFSVEFPGSHLVIGNSPMKPEGKIERKGFTLRLVRFPPSCATQFPVAQDGGNLTANYFFLYGQAVARYALVAIRTRGVP
ncbi:MAG: hypothetical protein IPJ71_12610 [Bdellovibrionales bacterium]|nr:hypothetical protein [Bdellovibrionales bacterium]